MGAPLKDGFGPDVPPRIAAALVAVFPAFEHTSFVAQCLDGLDDLELTARGHHVAAAMADHLPDDRAEAIALVTASLDHTPPDPNAETNPIAGFYFMPHGYLVASVGLEHFAVSMTALYEITKRFTSEFSIRPFIEHDEPATLAQLRLWTSDPDHHVRRLVSEGTRPRLPWSPQLKSFIADPTPVFELLELLKDDPEEYVRRSVANNLNDIAKDHPDVAIGVAQRWWADGDTTRRRLIRHALRTLIKKGNPEALAVLGYHEDSPLQITATKIEPNALRIGEKLRITVTLSNPTKQPVGGLIDLAVHFVKANGSTNPKVFKGAEIEVAAGDTHTVTKTISVAQHSTRKHYPGTHNIDVIVNGVAHPVDAFDLQA